MRVGVYSASCVVSRVAAFSLLCASAARTTKRRTPANCQQKKIATLETLAALMPLLQQESSRGCGSSNENRRSLADFLGLDASPLREPAPVAANNHRANDGSQGSDCDWRWDEPGSPEVAHTPRALVPPGCFPPRHPRAFTSYSERARPGNWPEENVSGQGITDLVASLKALAMPASSARSAQLQVRLSFADPTPTPAPTPAPDSHALTRRASFCGAEPAEELALGFGEVARWSGSLPSRGVDPGGGFSPKVFLGGLPYDISEHALMHTLRQFQPVRVEWPGREGAGGAGGPRGFAYVTLESERRVRALLAASRRDGNDWYYRVASRRVRTKDVQVIPWAVSDSNWVSGGSARLEPARTVFVGALHGMLSASALAYIMNELFSGVVYAGIDTDKNKYPIGSGRVTFNNVRSYVRAISAGYVEITTDKFTKKIQVDPYLEDSMCSVCNVQQGPYFCREPMCFRYLCRSCWVWQHTSAGEEHRPLMRSSRSPRPRLGDHYAGFPLPAEDAGNNAGTHAGTPSPPNSATSGGSGASALSEFEQTAAAEEPAAVWPQECRATAVAASSSRY